MGDLFVHVGITFVLDLGYVCKVMSVLKQIALCFSEPYLYFYFYLSSRGLAWQLCCKQCYSSPQHPPKPNNRLSPLPPVELSYSHIIMVPCVQKPSSSPNIRSNYSRGKVAISLFTNLSCSLATSAQVTYSAFSSVAKKSVSETLL
jgi:hypothetical protein